MTTAKRFTARQKVAPPIPFELEVTYLPDPDATNPEERVERTVVHELAAIGVAPLMAVTDMLDGINGTAVSVKSSIDFLHAVVLPEHQPILDAVLTDSRVAVDADLLTDISLWLLGEYGKRPTEPSSDSSDGREPIAAGSTAN